MTINVKSKPNIEVTFDQSINKNKDIGGSWQTKTGTGVGTKRKVMARKTKKLATKRKLAKGTSTVTKAKGGKITTTKGKATKTTTTKPKKGKAASTSITESASSSDLGSAMPNSAAEVRCLDTVAGQSSTSSSSNIVTSSGHGSAQSAGMKRSASPAPHAPMSPEIATPNLNDEAVDRKRVKIESSQIENTPIKLEVAAAVPPSNEQKKREYEFVCKHCPRVAAKFPTEEARNQHVTQDHLDLVECNFCVKFFADKEAMFSHVRKEHTHKL